MIISNLPSFALAVISTLFLCQCASNRIPELKQGEAYLDASPANKHRAQLTGFRIVSVNGKKARGSATHIPIGPVKAVVAFNWPKVGKKQVPLNFNARQGHVYFMKYDRFPHPDKQGKGLAGVSKGLMTTGAHLHILGFPFFGAGVVVGFVEHVRQGLGIRTRLGRAASYIDLYVISTLSSEGVVRKVRTYPSGRVENR